MPSLADHVRNFCSSHRLELLRERGQHFLIDETVLADILETAKLTGEDHVVEIGAGIGVLTLELLKRAKAVTAIENDARLIPLLREFTGFPSHLTIVEGNALRAPFPSTPYRIVANIPYHITSPLLRHAYLESVPPEAATLLIQREVAEKICSTEDRGILTILVGLFGTPSITRIVEPESFLPPPEVDSAVLTIESFPQPLASRPVIDRLFRLTKAAFSQKRKMLRNTLGAFPAGAERLERVGIDLKRRPQTLTVAEWIALAQEFGDDAPA